MAFKSTDEKEESASDEDNKEMTLITRKFKRFMKKKLRSGKRNEGKGEFSKESTIICYKCKNPGHIKVECLLLKKKEKKEKWKRPMVAMTWSDNEESGSKNDAKHKKVANLCLMAHEDEDEVSNSNSF